LIDKIVSKVLIDQNQRSHTRPNHIHWPSEASIVLDGNTIGSCHREKYLMRKGYTPDKEISVENLRKMKVGKSIEQTEIELAKEAGIWLADDVSFKFSDGDITVSGKLDAIYKDSAGNSVCVEYKTSAGWDFIKRVYGGTGTNSKNYAVPRMEHVLQTILYLHALPDLKYGIIFYLNRESMATIEHRVELMGDHILINKKKVPVNIAMPPMDYTPTYREEDIDILYADKVISKFEYERWQSTGEVPGEKQCSWCMYSDTCKGINGIPASLGDIDMAPALLL
jgi:hypothetical protein